MLADIGEKTTGASTAIVAEVAGSSGHAPEHTNGPFFVLTGPPPHALLRPVRGVAYNRASGPAIDTGLCEAKFRNSVLMARVVIENLAKVFKGARGEEVYAVRELDLTIEDREFLVLVGPSGCGKSTTLRMIAGLEEISRGSISIDDKRVNDLPPKDRDIAMVFQNYALYPHMTVFENMAFGLKLRKFPKAEIQQRVREAAEILGLSPYLDRKPKALSGGQRQRVAVGRAIVRRPKVFLFDEPLSNLDAQMRVQMRAEIAKLHTRLQATMIYVTHDQLEAMTLGDRIVVMKEGVIQQVADPLHLYQQPVNMFVARFIGSPPMNFFAGTIARRDGEFCFQEGEDPAPSGDGNLCLRLPECQRGQIEGSVGRPVVLGIRPEHVALGENEGSASQNTFAARVEVVELLGSETYLYLKTGRYSFVARVPASLPPKVNTTVPVHLDLTKAHFFDPETGRVIRSELSRGQS